MAITESNGLCVYSTMAELTILTDIYVHQSSLVEGIILWFGRFSSLNTDSNLGFNDCHLTDML